MERSTKGFMAFLTNPGTLLYRDTNATRVVGLAFCFVAILLGLANNENVEAATIAANSCSGSDVQRAIDSAADGDVVAVPGGSCTWTTPVVVNLKAITLQGSGIGQTIIKDGTPKNTSPWTAALSLNTKVGGLMRVTGFSFIGGGLGDGAGMITTYGPSQTVRIDHNDISPRGTWGIKVFNQVGVADHNIFHLVAPYFAFHIQNGYDWSRTGTCCGDVSWATASQHGSDQFFFIEDNVFSGVVGQETWPIDAWNGSRYVFRYNNLTQTNNATTHGTATPGRDRGARATEFYENTFTRSNNYYPGAFSFQSGTGVAFNNRINGTYEYVGDVNVDRPTRTSTPWGLCNGTNVWDQNATSNGGACLDQPGRGAGDLLTGGVMNPVNTARGNVAAWPRQPLEPIYAWGNLLNGVPTNMKSAQPGYLAEGRDFFNTVKPGYTPYTYPHPLTTGAGSNNPPPAPPQNLTVR